MVQRNLTETQEQLALILTNSTARELTYLEKAEQAVRLKRLFINAVRRRRAARAHSGHGRRGHAGECE